VVSIGYVDLLLYLSRPLLSSSNSLVHPQKSSFEHNASLWSFFPTSLHHNKLPPFEVEPAVKSKSHTIYL